MVPNGRNGMDTLAVHCGNRCGAITIPNVHGGIRSRGDGGGRRPVMVDILEDPMNTPRVLWLNTITFIRSIPTPTMHATVIRTTIKVLAISVETNSRYGAGMSGRVIPYRRATL